MDASLQIIAKPRTLTAKPSAYRWIIPTVLLLVVISGFFDRISVAVLFSDKQFQDDMGIGFNPTKMGLLMTGFLFAYGLSGVLFSWMVDLYGPSRMLSAGVVFWGICMLLMGASGGFVGMLAYRCVLGLSEGPQFGIANALVRRWFPKAERARANAVWTIGSPLGSAIGFPLTIWLVHNYGWRASFYALGAVNLIVILPLVLFFIRDKAAAVEAPVAAVGTNLVSFREALSAFITKKDFWLVTIFGCGVLVYLWGVNSWLPSYLIKERHMDPAGAGFYASLPFIMTIIGQLTGAYVSDRLGKRAIIAGIGLIGAGLCILCVPLTPNAHTAAIMLAGGGFFWGGATPTKYALISEIIPEQALATGVGITNGIGNLVGAGAPLAIGLVISSTGSFDLGFMVIVAATLVGGAALIPLMRRY